MNKKCISKIILINFTFVLGLYGLMNNPGTLSVSAKGGAEIYQQNCATCHGNDGKANTSRGKRKGATDLTKSKIGNAAGIKVITNGRDSMPAFGDSLSAAQIREVMNFIRGFRGK